MGPPMGPTRAHALLRADMLPPPLQDAFWPTLGYLCGNVAGARVPVSQPDASARARGQYPQRLACAAEMTSKDLERGDAGRSRRADEMAELASARIVTSHVTTINNKRAGRELPTEAAPLLGSSEDRPRSSGFGMARKIVGGVVLATCVGVAALSGQTRGYFMRKMGSADQRPFIVVVYSLHI